MTTGPSRSGSPLDHHEIWELLPWYVNGSLEDCDLQTIERHLSACGECRQEVAYLQRLSRVLTSAESTVQPPDGAFSEVLLKIENVEAAKASQTPRRLRDLLSPRPIWRPLMGIQMLLILGLAFAFWQRAAETPPVFRTLSRPATVAPSSQLLVRMVFAPEVEEKDLRGLLLEMQGQIVGGPSPYGVYTVELSSPEDSQMIALLLEEIRSREEVEFLEPIQRRR